MNSGSTVLRGPTLLLDLDAAVVHRDGETHPLTTLEVRVLRHLAERMDEPVRMESLLRDVWGYRDGVVTKAVYESMRRLRRKVERDPENPLHLMTEWGTGYRLRGLVREAAGPTEPDPLFGREGVAGTLRALLQNARLVTLTGPGGVGKTSLAQRVAAEEGAVWVELDACRDATDLRSAVAGALELRAAGDDLDAALTRTLRDRGPGLLVLDNFEQLADDAGVIAGWLKACPRLRLLVTSRRALHLREERILLVPPLGAPLEPDAAHPAVALLLARLREVSPGFSATEEDLAAATRIVRAVDGLPLAVEIVAARARLGTLADLARRVETSVFELPSTRRDLPARQLSLETTLTWSWLLLSDAARRALAQLVVFEGTATIEAAERVVELATPVPLALDELVDANLLQVRGDRLHPYVGVRELVRAKEGTGPLAPDVRGAATVRLWRWALALDEARRPMELDNLRGALRTAQADAPVEVVAQLARVWVRALLQCRPLGMASAELAPFLARADLPDAERVELLFLGVSIAQLRGDVPGARRWLAEAVAPAERLGIPTLGRVRLWEGVLLHDEKRLADAEAAYRDALGMIDPDREPVDHARALVTLTYALLEAGRVEAAVPYVSEALDRAHALGHDRLLGNALMARARVEVGRGTPAAAAPWCERALDVARRAQNPAAEHLARSNLGLARLDAGAWAEAREALLPSVDGHRRLGHDRFLALTLVYLGRAEAGLGNVDAAMRAFGEAIDLAQRVVVPEGEGAARAWRGRLRVQLGDADGHEEIRRGAAMLRAAGDEAGAARVEGS